MPITRSFTKPFELVDYTQELILVPNTWGLVNSLNLFRPESVSQHSIIVESTNGTLAVIPDQVRGAGRNNVNKDDTRVTRSFAIPHFPLDDALSPEDIQGKRAYGSPDAAESEAAVLARKMERIRRNHAVTMEFARCQAITQGTVYAPNGTVAHDFYSEFGVSRKIVGFDLNNAAIDVLAKGEEVIAHIQDNILTGEVVSSVMALCSPEFFGKLIAHPKVATAYQFYTSTQEPLRQRLGGGGLYRRFEFGGITYVEYRGEYNGSKLIPANEAYFIPEGTVDMFITYFSPANKMSLVNTLGEEAYMFAYNDPHDEGMIIQSEHNALHLIRRPAAVVRGTVAA